MINFIRATLTKVRIDRTGSQFNNFISYVNFQNYTTLKKPN